MLRMCYFALPSSSYAHMQHDTYTHTPHIRTGVMRVMLTLRCVVRRLFKMIYITLFLHCTQRIRLVCICVRASEPDGQTKTECLESNVVTDIRR